MKTKLLLLVCLAFTLVGQARAQFKVKMDNPTKVASPMLAAENGENKLVYAFCTDEIDRGAYVNTDVEVRAYLRIPAKQYKGCKITNVDFGFAYEAGRDSYMFISKDLEGEPLVKQDFQCDTIPVLEEEYLGWKKIPFDTPYVIDSDEDLYVGLYAIEKYGHGIFGLDGNLVLPGGNLVSFRRLGKEKWSYTELSSNLCIKVTLEGENIPQHHLRVCALYVDQQYYRLGDDMTIEGSIVNEGNSCVKSFDLTYNLNDEVITEHISDVNLLPFRCYDFEKDITINKEGRGNLILSVENPNGTPDDAPECTSLSDNSFGCISKGYQKNVLIDEVVDTKVPEVVGANEIIKNAMDNCSKKDCVFWMQNHAVAHDEYDIPGFGDFEMLFWEASFIPAVTLNHKMVPGTLMCDAQGNIVDAEGELFIIDSDFDTHLNKVLEEETLYSLNAECQKEGDVLKIKVTGKPIIDGLFPYIMNPGLALLLVEDNVVGEQAGVEGDYVHNGVPRAFLTYDEPEYALLGTKIQIPDEGFTFETEYTVTDKSWNFNNMHLLCYIMDSGMRVDNVTWCKVQSGPDAINSAEAEKDFTLICTEGTLHIQGGRFDKATIFTSNGQQVIAGSDADINISALNKGIYCVLIQSGNQTVAKKFIVR